LAYLPFCLVILEAKSYSINRLLSSYFIERAIVLFSIYGFNDRSSKVFILIGLLLTFKTYRTQQ
jgi:hypothetical protein